MQKRYFRDIWVLGPNNTGYPGGFPNGLINKIKKLWWGKNKLMLFSGSFRDKSFVTVDIKQEVKPDIVANCEQLPFNNETFDFVMSDPPYSKEESERLYNLSYVSIVKTLNEMARVCKSGGIVIFLHRVIPQVHPHLNGEFKRLKIIGLVGVTIISGFTNLRALTVWRKLTNLDVWMSK